MALYQNAGLVLQMYVVNFVHWILFHSSCSSSHTNAFFFVSPGKPLAHKIWLILTIDNAVTSDTVILAYDILLTLSQEVNCIWRRKFSAVTILYGVIRYGTLLQLVLQFLAAFWSSAHIIVRGTISTTHVISPMLARGRSLLTLHTKSWIDPNHSCSFILNAAFTIDILEMIAIMSEFHSFHLMTEEVFKWYKFSILLSSCLGSNWIQVLLWPALFCFISRSCTTLSDSGASYSIDSKGAV